MSLLQVCDGMQDRCRQAQALLPSFGMTAMQS